jgi:uncharacterized protein (TIGR03083 family)
MNDTYTDISTITRIERGAEAESLGSAMYARLFVELESLDTEQWNLVTVCEPWTVADMARHLLGAARGHASLAAMARQAVYGRRHRAWFGGNDMDAMNALQVADHADLDPARIISELRLVAPRAVAKRMNRPGLIRRMRLPMSAGGSTAAGMPASLTLGELFKVILTRDVLMHRIDIARATGRTVQMDAASEGRLIEDVAVEWADRHGQAFTLTLTGPAGGRYKSGAGGAEIELDAADFCWILSGRGEAPHPLLETRVLF